MSTAGSPPTARSTGVSDTSPPVVGLGASAGGLEALELFLANVPGGSGLAYVVVQHMDPHHKAMLAELLQRVTPMPVQEAVDGMRLRPDSVYVIPPDRELTVVKGLLHLEHSTQPRGVRQRIDLLFESIARDQGAQAIGVVLSGMGADGTLGLQAIKRQGGLTLAQEPASAQFDSMPRNAIAAAAADIVAPPGELPQRIIQAMAGATPPSQPMPPDPGRPGDSLAAILQLLREHTRHDLSLYKTSTLMRRIERRVALHNLNNFGDYAALLKTNPQERELLFAEMLIGVTSFFRDPEVWQDLAEHVLPGLLAGRTEATPLRAWVIGCSTGEEAYTLAMALREAQDTLPGTPQQIFQIFATDLSADAIAAARKGWYSARSVEGLSPQRLKRFFTAQAGGFRIDNGIRTKVLFAQHDVIRDPPFTRLDILTCRNVLIYFKAALQHRLMPLFHFSLRPGGVLLLGGSETIGRAQSLFTQLGSKSKLYQRCDLPVGAGTVDFPVNYHTALHKTPQETIMSPSTLPHPGNLQSMADQLLLQTYSPSAVLVNAAGEILYVSGRTGRFLEPAAGKANWNIHAMARPGIRAQLAAALRQALQDQKTIELTGLRVEDGEQYLLNLTIQALREPKALAGMAMVVFREIIAPRPSAAEGPDPSGLQQQALNLEIERLRSEVRALHQEMQISKEELQATNEELQSANEELQSANEELTTSKEESQSMNEELQTINGELQTKLDDLALAQSDMQNLLNSTDIATLFLDNELQVRRFTEQAARIFHLRDGDIGRPLSDLASTLDYPALNQDVLDTLRTLTSSIKQVPTSDGRWLSVRVMPYRTLTNQIQGAVLTFVDITKAKELEFRLREGYSEP
ncbi:MAG: chemotaxis protein CheB [Burkholderiaceae bacterium]|nr:chemotaxis protein CheB [Burkholderiaceae bacterium]MDO9090026.1 chemotaxis protein CheB [Burkholderiaceae bacterium]